MARAGYIEAPRDPDLAYEFLKTECAEDPALRGRLRLPPLQRSCTEPVPQRRKPIQGKGQGRLAHSLQSR